MCSSTLLINKTPATRCRFARVGPHLSAKSQSQEIPLDRGPLAVVVRTASEAGWEENDCPSIFPLVSYLIGFITKSKFLISSLLHKYIYLTHSQSIDHTKYI